MSTALLYENLKKATAKINDQHLTELVASLEPLLGTDDGKPETHFLPSYMAASRAVSQSHKFSVFTAKYNKWLASLADPEKNITPMPVPTAVKTWTKEGTLINGVIAYSNNLFPFVNDEGDAIINAIFERVIELAA